MSVKKPLVLMRCALVALCVLFACNMARCADLPPYLRGLVGTPTPAPGEIATQNVLQLNTTMFDLYANTGAVFKKNILANHPVILALFSGAGGRFILYRPGMAPIEAPPVPIAYQLLKSVGHSTMALAEVVGPYLDNPADQSWLGSMLAYRSRMQSALDGIGETDMSADWQGNSRQILKNNLSFMDLCIAKKAISFAALQAFAAQQEPLLRKNIAWAAQTQVDHWMKIVGAWKKSLGPDWDKTYAASNTIYVARQNNVIFSVLAQYFGADAINDRLMLIETISFTTTPEDMLELDDPDHRGPVGRRRVLWQLSSDGLRADGWRRTPSHHRRRCQAWVFTRPAAARAVRFPPVANADHPGSGGRLSGAAAGIMPSVLSRSHWFLQQQRLP